ncbi:hypothetical protein TNCV_4145961 [Trichonephila clavipes]|nr:hypothetical protein TNCV_4145961 [Trichonephila clavipes]
MLVARVKTETGELARPVQRLYKLELQEPEINLPKDLTDSDIRTRRGRKLISPKHRGSIIEQHRRASSIYTSDSLTGLYGPPGVDDELQCEKNNDKELAGAGGT